jgi:hypothetical protein
MMAGKFFCGDHMGAGERFPFGNKSDRIDLGEYGDARVALDRGMAAGHAFHHVLHTPVGDGDAAPEPENATVLAGISVAKKCVPPQPER